MGGRSFAVVSQLPVSVSCVAAHIKYQLKAIREKLVADFVRLMVWCLVTLWAVFFSYSVTKAQTPLVQFVVDLLHSFHFVVKHVVKEIKQVEFELNELK